MVIGGVGIDTIIRVDDLPVPLADSVMVEPIHAYVAHSGTGVALGCRHLGLAVKFVDFIGKDQFGADILARFEEEGLDFSWLENPAGTRRAVNLVDVQGRRMSFFDARDVPGQVMPEEFYEDWLAAARHVHISNADYARHAIPVARRHGIPISTDLHAWDGEGDYNDDFAHHADLVFMSAAALNGRPGDVMRGILANGRAELVVATNGADGAYLAIRGSDEVRHFPAIAPRNPVVDSNGAGDAFTSGFLSGRLGGAPVEVCMERGIRGGAFACTIRGTAEGFAGPRDLEG
jgi:acarbose 7IV-phosphotransferase